MCANTHKAPALGDFALTRYSERVLLIFKTCLRKYKRVILSLIK